MQNTPIMRWFLPGINIKRWLLLLLLGISAIASGLVYGIMRLAGVALGAASPVLAVAAMSLGGVCIAVALYRIYRTLSAPYQSLQIGHPVDVVYSYNRKQKGIKVVALGGGTGLPAALRAMKAHTSNITAIVTVADDGGSSGRLRRELGVQPPGDLRNNIVALADDESLMAQLFQYRFTQGALDGHAFGNLFIAALAGVAGGLENALVETARVLNIQGRVLPSTLQDIHLLAEVRQPGKARSIKIQGESQIGEFGGQIESIALVPADAEAYPDSVQAILDAELVVIGPGSLYTSILPNLLVMGILEALRATRAYKIYICNVATQPGETEGYSVAEHVLALEQHIGRGVFQAVVANNAFPTENAGANTTYVPAVSQHHEIAQRYEVVYGDLTDNQRPWRHDSRKLAALIFSVIGKSVRPSNSAS
ncbi:MAG: YvcK family protein [Armatimonadetes bacterium]|nr:YvcK family protein [Anaerolineae bacterium]